MTCLQTTSREEGLAHWHENPAPLRHRAVSTGAAAPARLRCAACALHDSLLVARVILGADRRPRTSVPFICLRTRSRNESFREIFRKERFSEFSKIFFYFFNVRYLQGFCKEKILATPVFIIILLLYSSFTRWQWKNIDCSLMKRL